MRRRTVYAYVYLSDLLFAGRKQLAIIGNNKLHSSAFQTSELLIGHYPPFSIKPIYYKKLSMSIA